MICGVERIDGEWDGSFCCDSKPDAWYAGIPLAYHSLDVCCRQLLCEHPHSVMTGSRQCLSKPRPAKVQRSLILIHTHIYIPFTCAEGHILPTNYPSHNQIPVLSLQQPLYLEPTPLPYRGGNIFGMWLPRHPCSAYRSHLSRPNNPRTFAMGPWHPVDHLLSSLSLNSAAPRPRHR